MKQEKQHDEDNMRLAKRMAVLGLCSRREADAYILKGWVKVNGIVTKEKGLRISPQDKITLSPLAQEEQEKRVTIILHKPLGYVSGQPEKGYKAAVELIRRENRWLQDKNPITFQPKHTVGLAPAGRLDIDSTGLLVLTQEGRIAKQLIGSDTKVEKEYLVRVTGNIIPNGLQLLNHGLSLDGEKLRPAKVKWQQTGLLLFILKQGKKRQIRRMCELVGLKVVALKRVRIGNIVLGNLPPGKWRYLRKDEHF
jgi:23S rRNA pseudouridine2604 synthase